jgi:hypothetical protein
MDNTQQLTSLICPFCDGVLFSVETKGMFIKSTFYECQKCKAVMETKNEKDFKITVVPEEYSNTQTFMKNREAERDELANLGLPVFSDTQLSEVSSGQGELFEKFLNELPTANISIILKSDEKIIAAFNNMTLLEEKSQRRSSGSFSIKIAKGLWFNTGSIYTSESSIEEIDTGVIALTNKRYIFIGNKKSIDQSLSKITSIQLLTDGVGILRSNKTKVEYYTGRYHWALVGSLLTGVVKRFG